MTWPLTLTAPSPPFPIPSESVAPAETAGTDEPPPRATWETAGPRNFSLLATFQIVMRCGWIFKTESIVMPIVFDLIGGGAWIRGSLPLINRLGQGLPPVLMSRRVKVMPRKKLALAITSLMMAACFLTLAAIWAMVENKQASWLPLTFLLIYAVFFAVTGVNQMCYHTLQGKLVEPTIRGRLMVVANGVGSVAAITLLLLLLPRWLTDTGGRFDLVFGLTGILFAATGLVALLLREPPDDYRHPPAGVHRLVGDVFDLLRRDANFRRLALVAALFGASMMIFPHYQALARGGRLQLGLRQSIGWIVLQNVGTGVFSLIAGPLADRRGSRQALSLVFFLLCGAPLAAIGLSHAGDWGGPLFPLVFLLVGVTPVVIKTLNHYVLEIAPQADHPRFIGAIGLCMTGPIFFSPAVGALIDIVGFDAVFLPVSALIFFGWLVTFGLAEPRHGEAAESQRP